MSSNLVTAEIVAQRARAALEKANKDRHFVTTEEYLGRLDLIKKMDLARRYFFEAVQDDVDSKSPEQMERIKFIRDVLQKVTGDPHHSIPFSQHGHDWKIMEICENFLRDGGIYSFAAELDYHSIRVKPMLREFGFPVEEPRYY